MRSSAADTERMSAVKGLDRSTPVVTPGLEAPSPSSEKPLLRPPEVQRQGALPTSGRNRWSMFRGQLLAGATMAAIAATSLPLMTGCGFAETRTDAPPAVEEVRGAPTQQAQATLRGQFVEAPGPGGDQSGLWMVPLKNQDHFTIDGQQHDRLFIGAIGSDATAGLTPGSLGDLRASVVSRNTGDGVLLMVDTVDAVVAGLPRAMAGAVRQGAAPGSEPGSDATDLFLVLDSAIWLDGKKVDVVHLGAAEALAAQGVIVGDQLTVDGRVDTNEHGARLASAETIAAQHYPGSEVAAPTFDGVAFRPIGAAPGDKTLPVIDLPSSDRNRRQVVVVDADMGVAHLGSVARRAGSEKFDATLAVQAFLRGGPTFQVDGGTVRHEDGSALKPRSNWVEHGANGDVHQGWYHHEASDVLYQLRFHLDADGHAEPAKVTHAIALNPSE